MAAPKKPPQGLSAESAALWRKTLSDFAFCTASDLALLAEYCRCHDRLADLRAAIKKDGVTVDGSRGQMRPNPLLAAENDARRALIALARALGLTGTEEE